MTNQGGDAASRVPTHPRVADPKPRTLPIVSIDALVRHISPFCEPEQRTRVLRALHAACDGTPEGLAIAMRWCRQWPEHPSDDEIAMRWRSIADDSGSHEP